MWQYNILFLAFWVVLNNDDDYELKENQESVTVSDCAQKKVETFKVRVSTKICRLEIHLVH